MRAEQAIRKGLAEVRRAWRSERFDDALAALQELLILSPANPTLLVMRAQLTQLQEGQDGAPTLAHAERDLRLAGRLDEHSPVPMIELSYFTYVMKDDAKAASRLFGEAITRCRDLLREALLGQAKALSELGRDAEALACLAEAQSIRSADGRQGGDELIEQFRTILQAN